MDGNPRMYFSRIVFFAALALFISVPGAPAHAARLFLAPASGNFSVGQTFAVSILVDSVGESINAVSGTISFPHGLLEAQSTSKKDSIIDIWTIEPSVSHESGTVAFEGVALKGFSGSRGMIVSIP